MPEARKWISEGMRESMIDFDKRLHVEVDIPMMHIRRAFDEIRAHGWGQVTFDVANGALTCIKVQKTIKI